ncbi:unnamed protein product [Ceutorhynchus assimilis]|uniref:Uncharacterized protein n=1 Tax=Ceutorhynchus assimilis TaxID=467358 RepID=A0A9N9MSA3_9CUCU|nr:unnamed protein product [Ceutorhynchus assimilis]
MKIIFILTLTAYFSQAEVTFRSFQVQHKKKYSALELTRREQIFNQNLIKIQKNNEKYRKGLVSYQMGINQFSDLTEEEFSSRFKTLPLNNTKLKNVLTQDSNNFNISDLPESIDWREKGIVTEVKDQGLCGACWAFSATGALEGQLALNYKTLIPISEQQLIDCDTKVNVGCDGGYIQEALQFATTNGLTTEENYPYIQARGYCRKWKKNVVRGGGYVNILPYNETDLKLAVGLMGPVSVAIHSGPFQFYQSGIHSGAACTDNVDHGVLVVGYGKNTSSQEEYWLLKNSWGTSWGENGYFKLAMSKNNTGLCGIAKQSCYPINVTNCGYSLVQNVLVLGLVCIKLFF